MTNDTNDCKFSAGSGGETLAERDHGDSGDVNREKYLQHLQQQEEEEDTWEQEGAESSYIPSAASYTDKHLENSLSPPPLSVVPTSETAEPEYQLLNGYSSSPRTGATIALPPTDVSHNEAEPLAAPATSPEENQYEPGLESQRGDTQGKEASLPQEFYQSNQGYENGVNIAKHTDDNNQSYGSKSTVEFEAGSVSLPSESNVKEDGHQTDRKLSPTDMEGGSPTWGADDDEYLGGFSEDQKQAMTELQQLRLDLDYPGKALRYDKVISDIMQQRCVHTEQNHAERRQRNGSVFCVTLGGLAFSPGCVFGRS